MKFLIFPILFLATQACANTSSDTVIFSGVVPVTISVDISKTSDLMYCVHEFSNNPNGYSIILHTDADKVVYNGELLTVSNGEVILTQITHQDKTIDIMNRLIFTTNSTVGYIQISGN